MATRPDGPAAAAFLGPLGSVDGHISGIGITLGHGSWPDYDQADAATELRVWPETKFWDSPGRFATVPHWADPRHIDTPGGRFTNSPAARRQPAVIPWHPGWTGAGGTTANKDNGLIVNNDDGTHWILQGLRPGHIGDAIAITARTLRLEGWTLRAATTKPGDMIADAIRYIAPGIAQRGSQGPASKLEGRLRPEHLTGEVEMVDPIGVVALNVMHGPGAVAAPGGWVEHPDAGQRNSDPTLTIHLPEGFRPDVMVPAWQRLGVDITDDEIEQLLDRRGLPQGSVYRWTCGQFARLARRVKFRVKESGTGAPIVESSGGVKPSERQKWANLGVVTDADARNLGADLFTAGRLYDA